MAFKIVGNGPNPEALSVAERMKTVSFQGLNPCGTQVAHDLEAEPRGFRPGTMARELGALERGETFEIRHQTEGGPLWTR